MKQLNVVLIGLDQFLLTKYFECIHGGEEKKIQNSFFSFFFFFLFRKKKKINYQPTIFGTFLYNFRDLFVYIVEDFRTF